MKFLSLQACLYGLMHTLRLLAVPYINLLDVAKIQSVIPIDCILYCCRCIPRTSGQAATSKTLDTTPLDAPSGWLAVPCQSAWDTADLDCP